MLGKMLMVAAAFGCGMSVPTAADVQRSDFRLVSEPGIELFVRQVRMEAQRSRGSLILIHGARVGALASFDVDVPGYSLAADLATAGYSVYLADVRGYGRSSFPKSMSGDRFRGSPAVPTAVAVRDIQAVIREVRRRHPGESVAAMGWATGSHWLAATEAAHPGSIDRLVFYNSVYGGNGPWRLTKLFARPGSPATFNFTKFGRYRLSTAESLVGRWTNSDAISDAFVRRYVEIAMAGDPSAKSRTPSSFRHPSGPIADTLRAVHGAPLYDAGTIRSHVLILRSEKDFWSRPVDVETLQRDLKRARSVTVRELPDASHYVHLEPGQGRQQFLDAVIAFASATQSSD
ncbi:MAG: alpha/beta hydrolase [Pseudomonadota bacterium]